MSYRQTPRQQQGGAGSKSSHGTQCPCAVCTDLNSVADSMPSQRRQGGSLASQSYVSGNTSQGPPYGDPANGSVGKRSHCSGRDDSIRSHPNRAQSERPSRGNYLECVPDPNWAGPPQVREDRTRESCAPHPQRAGENAPERAGEKAPERAGEKAPGRCVEKASERGERPKSAGKNKPKKSPSATRPKGGKGAASAPAKGGGQAPRPLCLAPGRMADKSMDLDECDLDDLEDEEEEDVCPAMAAEPAKAPGKQPYDQTVAERHGLEAAPFVSASPEKTGPMQPISKDLLRPWEGGTLPIADSYSNCKYSEDEWRQRNLETIERAAGDTSRSNALAFNARAYVSEVLTAASKNQRDVTQRLQIRNAEVRHWLFEVKKSYQDLWKQIKSCSAEDDRLRRIMCVLEGIINLIVESLKLRATRSEIDLTCDDVDKEMNKELALANGIKQLLQRTRDELRKQLDSTRAAKLRLEQDISDKEAAVGIDCAAINLRVDSSTIMFYDGTDQFPDNQTSSETWGILSRDNLSISKTEVSKLLTLQAIIDRIIKDSRQELLTQKANTEDAMIKHITAIASIIDDLEIRLKLILKSIAETEKVIQEIKENLRRLDFPLKKAQTRLKTRADRQRNENTRDCPQYALIAEMKTLGEQATCLMEQLAASEEMLDDLCKTRSFLERELQSKKKTLFIDRDRILRQLRQDYPPAEALMHNASSLCLPCV